MLSRTILTCGLALALAACGDSTGPKFGPPSTATVVAGDAQTAVVGTAVEIAPVVRVSDAEGRPVPGLVVPFAVTAGDGSVTGSPATTDAEGTARLEGWTLGTRVGENQLTVRLADVAPVTITATAVAGAPSTMKPVEAGAQAAVVGEPVATPPAVVVQDAFGNPVPDVAVDFAVAAGGGSVAGASATTDAQGVATVGTWTLGTTAGVQMLTASISGLTPVTFTATATAGAAESMTVQAGGDQSATVGTAVQTRPTVKVVDRFGNPVAGVEVTFAASANSGTVAPALVTSDAGGVAAVGSWTLGTTAGAQMLTASTSGVRPVTFTATAKPDAPATATAQAGNLQAGMVGTAVAVAPAVLVQDKYGNPVPEVAVKFSVLSGRGSLTGAEAVTGADGIATVGSWTLGALAGNQAVYATASGLPPVNFFAAASSTTLNLSVEAVHLNQGSQNLAGTIGGVAGRPGLLRIVLRANEENLVKPQVRLRLYQGGSLVREEILRASAAGVPLNADLDSLDQTWNLPLDAAEVVAGLSVEARVDPGSAILESSKADNGFPLAGGTASLDVRTIPPLNMVFIPIVATVQGTTGNVTAANVSDYLRNVRKWIPTSTISTSIRAPYTTNVDLSDGRRWTEVLSEIQAVRTIEGATDQYYHGIIGDFQGIPWGGYGYIPWEPSSLHRSGISYDRLPHAAAVLAHELGHNLGRRHTPCGNAGNLDPNYPHSDARIGPPSYDIDSGALAAAPELRDFMSYCRPQSTSDYTYNAMLQWRRSDPLAGGSGDVAASVGRTSGLLLWGRIDSGGATLNPAFALEAVSALPDAPGPNVLRGVAADGREVFRFSFRGVPPADGPDPEERHFSFFVPLSAAEIETIERIELAAPRELAVQASTGAAAQVAGAATGPLDPDVRIEPIGGDHVRLQWNTARFPMAMVRDAATGQVLAFVQGGDASVATGALGLGRLQVLVSDGTRTRVATPE